MPRIKWYPSRLKKVFKSEGVRSFVQAEADRMLPAVEADLAARSGVKSHMKLLTADSRILKHTAVGVIHGYGPVGENIAKKYGLRG